jgi:hypothetical protein
MCGGKAVSWSDVKKYVVSVQQGNYQSKVYKVQKTFFLVSLVNALNVSCFWD